MRLLMSVALLLLAFAAGAQVSKETLRRLDSAARQITAMPDDSLKAEAYNSLTLECERRGTFEQGVGYASQFVALARRIKSPLFEMKALIDLGNMYTGIYAYPEALEAFGRALRIAEQEHLVDAKAALDNNIANIFFEQKKFSEALPYCLELERAAETMQDTTAIWFAANSLAIAYGGLGNHAKALWHQQRAVRILQAAGDSLNLALMYANVGDTYYNLGQADSALEYGYRALELARPLMYSEVVATALDNIGSAYLFLARNGLPAARAGHVPASRQEALSMAIDALEKAVATSKQIKRYPALMHSARDLAEAYALNGNYAAALEAHETYSDIKDSILNQRNSATLRNFQVQRAVSLKDKELRIAQLELARKRNARYALLAGIIVLLGVSLMLFRNVRRQRLTNKKLAQEKQRSEDLLLNILPAEVAAELKENGSATARLYENVTVLFTDLVNFTTVSGRLGPKALVGELNECFSAFDAIITRHGLEKIKTVGDAYIAVCGLPASDPQHARKCVCAALEIRDFMEERKQNGCLSEIRIGVNSGPVVAGIVGLKKFAYDIWGETVNTAARMEQHGAPGRVNISQSTYQLVRGEFDCSPRGRVAAKNMGEVDMYFVEAPCLSFQL